MGVSWICVEPAFIAFKECVVKIDAGIPSTALHSIPELAQEAEAIGFDGLWSTETQHDPFLPLALVAEHSQRLQFGTAVAIGFARSPATLAYTAWDLAQVSGGRFILGLGTQVRAHIERRFGMSWPDSPVNKLREMLGAIRAFWKTWQTGERLDFQGDYFKLRLMTPFFNPGPIDHPEIPIYIAGVNTGLCRLAGEAADGFLVHPFHSARYLEEIIRPAIEKGAAKMGRDLSMVDISVTAMAVSDPMETDFVRSQIAFYASTPSYRPVMALHGWGEIADQLRELSRSQRWGEMQEIIDREMLETFAVVGTPESLPALLRERYYGLADRLSLYKPFLPGGEDRLWHSLVETMRSS
jgi:probable F420-dependent oxidoreductase